MRNVPAKSAGIVHHSFSPQQGVVATPLTFGPKTKPVHLFEQTAQRA
jgi:hypothetical protein